MTADPDLIDPNETELVLLIPIARTIALKNLKNPPKKKLIEVLRTRPNPNLNFLTQFHPLSSNFDVHDVHLSVAPKHVKHRPVHASHVNPADPEIEVGVLVNPAAQD